MNRRKRLGNRLRLIGYFLEVVAIGGWMGLHFQSAELQTKHNISIETLQGFQSVLIVLVLIGVVFIASGTFIRIKPPNAKEILEQRRAEREEE